MPMNNRLMRPRQGIDWPVLKQGMVAYWGFNGSRQPGGMLGDLSGNGNSITQQIFISAFPGRVLDAATAEQSDAGLFCNRTSLPASPGAITLAFWYRYGLSGLDESAVFSAYNGSIRIVRSFSFMLGNIGGFNFFDECGADSNNWLFVCVRYINSGLASLRIYQQNGVVISASGVGGEGYSGGDMQNLSFLSDSLAGVATGVGDQIDAFGYWSRLLSDAEVDWLYNGGQGREPPGQLMFMDEPPSFSDVQPARPTSREGTLSRWYKSLVRWMGW